METTQNPLASILSEFDITLVIDSSGSMSNPDRPGNSMTRWQAASELASYVAAEASKIDSDGIDVVTFGATVETYNGATPDTVSKIFSQTPRGSTPLHLALGQAFRVAGKSPKKDLVVVITDGEPDDPTAAANAIKQQANAQETDDALTILFMQVGNDGGATAYLKKLDDGIGAKHDIVDTMTADEVYKHPNLASALAAAITG